MHGLGAPAKRWPSARAVTAGLGVILIAWSLVSVPSRDEAPIVPNEGTLDLARDEDAMTAWVAVPNGMQVRWHSQDNAGVQYRVGEQQLGILDAGDDGRSDGCAGAGGRPIEVAMWWAHNSLSSGDQDARVTYSLTVETADASCNSAEVVRQTRDFGLSSETLPPEPALIQMLPAWIGAGTGALALCASFLMAPKRTDLGLAGVPSNPPRN